MDFVRSVLEDGVKLDRLTILRGTVASLINEWKGNKLLWFNWDVCVGGNCAGKQSDDREWAGAPALIGAKISEVSLLGRLKRTIRRVQSGTANK